MQVLWNTILLTIMLYTLYEGMAFLHRGRRRRLHLGEDARAGNEIFPSKTDGLSNLIRLLKIIVLVVTLYLLCLEGRSKYLYMYMSAFLMLFGTMFFRVGNASSFTLAVLLAGEEEATRH